MLIFHRTIQFLLSLHQVLLCEHDSFSYLAELTEETVEVPRVMRCRPLCSSRDAL